jgi:uncharacterized MAPEG superfamily protein
MEGLATASASIMGGDYGKTLAWCAGALVIKNMVNHLLVARARLAIGKMNQAVAPEGGPHMLGFNFLYYAMGSFAGPMRTENDIDRLLSMESNASQNETFFLILAALWPYSSGGVPAWASAALMYYTYSRMVHFVLYCFIKIQPWRGVVWAVGVMILLAMGVDCLGSSSSKVEL